MLLLVLMIFILFEKTFCKVFVTLLYALQGNSYVHFVVHGMTFKPFHNGCGIDECHISENTIYLCNISINNDVIVTMK